MIPRDRDANLIVGAGQMQLPFPKPADRGVSFLRGGARRYAERKGRSYSSEGLTDMQAEPQFQTRVAQKYEGMAVVPHHRIKRAYEALKSETNEQYDYLTRPRTEGGLGISVEFHPEDREKPLYPSHMDLVNDIKVNRRLKVAKTGESSGDTNTNELLDPETNDKFRAVHDAFGHAAIGRSFTRHGEEAAYHSHAQMFSSTAIPALAAETRGQNSTLNFGSKPGEFPEQRAVNLPQWALKDRRPKKFASTPPGDTR